MSHAFLTAAFYRFVVLDDTEQLRPQLLAQCQAQQVKGNVLLAHEGINGTIAGPEAGVRAVLAWLRADPRLAALVHKEAWATEDPFYRMKVSLKREIVTLGVPDVHAATEAGTYVSPQDWNQLIDDPDVAVVDVRNDYEVAIGSFQGAIDPHTRSFSEFPQWVERNEALLRGKSKVAMFCTGGIRCEKSTAYLRQLGFDEVYHLEGGILKYLETVDAKDSRWQGDCFVFDERVSVGHGLQPGDHQLCRSCRRPLDAADRASPLFVEGVSCAHCHGSTTAAQKSAYAERQRQMERAAARAERHVGQVFSPPPAAAP
jgi:UPF0176 protein